MLMAHSFGQYVLQFMGQYDISRPSQWHFVMVEWNAFSWNMLIFQALLSLQWFREMGREKVCMYCIVCDSNGTGNDCGVPHSMLSHAEQELQGDLYWIDDLIKGSTAFFHSNVAFGDSTVNTLEDPAVCQKLKVSSMEPMFDLALPSNWGLWLWFTADPKFSLLDEGLLVQNVTGRFSGAFTRPGSTS